MATMRLVLFAFLSCCLVAIVFARDGGQPTESLCKKRPKFDCLGYGYYFSMTEGYCLLDDHLGCPGNENKFPTCLSCMYACAAAILRRLYVLFQVSA
ncbi:hypothetical protein V5799_008519 [Amblyomma americanum]|uniref:Secreted protein n=1 Tax=Amblyomma americanum TaxID=6943 RepID=A0AAQ4FDT6_AMBAM